jgi:hypothetical protein
LLNCSHVAVYQWIKQYGEQAHLEALPATELEMDEMHSYVGSKKTLVGYELPLTEQESDSSTW